MTWIVERVHLERFLGYESLDLPVGRSGVVLVSGPVGSGKSSAVADAIAWCLYGRTIRTLLADDVIHDPGHTGKAKGCLVRIILSRGDDRWIVERYRKHKHHGTGAAFFRVNGDAERLKGAANEKRVTAEIANLLGVSWEQFSLINVFGQGLIGRFSGATDGERAEIVDKLLGTEPYAKARQVARSRLGYHDVRVRAIAAKAAGAQESIERIRNEQERVVQRSKDWWAARADELRANETKREALRADRGQLQMQLQPSSDIEALRDAALAVVQARRDEINTQTAALQAQAGAGTAALHERDTRRQQIQQGITAAAAEEHRARLAQQQAEAQAEVLLSRAEQLGEQLEAYREDLTCGSCGVDLLSAAEAGLYPVDGVEERVHRHEQAKESIRLQVGDAATRAEDWLRRAALRSEEAEQAAEQVQVGEAALIVLEDEYAGACIGCQRIAEQIARSETALTAYMAGPEAARLRDLERQVISGASGRRQTEQAIQQITQQVQRLEAEQAALAKQENPNDEANRALEREVIANEKAIKAAEAAKVAAEEEVADLLFWDRAFSPAGIRNLLLDSVLPQLNAAAARYSAVLGGGVQVTFSAQAELASGETRDRFSVLSAVVAGAHSYGGSSGGEKRLADVIQLFALRAVAARQQGLQILVLDEPMEALDEAYSGRVAELIASEQEALGGTVFLLSHQTALQEMFPKRLIARTEGGVSTLQEG